MKKILFLLLSAFSINASAQFCEQADNDIYKDFTAMNRFGTFGEEPDEDKLSSVTQKAVATLKNHLSQEESLSCPFSKSSEGPLIIVRSADNKVRAFSWDDQSGGTMRIYGTIIQYSDPSGKVHLKTEERIDFIKNIFTATLNNQTYYWIIRYSIAESGTHGTSATLYQINNNGFVPADLIKTKKLTHQIGYIFSPYSDVAEGDDSHPNVRNSDFRYDDKSKTLSFPVVIETSEYPVGQVTDKRIQYRFDGKYFVKIKN